MDYATKAFDDINYGIRKAHVKACWEFAGIDPLDLKKHTKSPKNVSVPVKLDKVASKYKDHPRKNDVIITV